MACVPPTRQHALWGQFPEEKDAGERAAGLITPHCSPVPVAHLAQVLQEPRSAGPLPSPLSLLPRGLGYPVPDVREVPEMALEEDALYAEPCTAALVPLKGAPHRGAEAVAEEVARAVTVSASEAGGCIAVRGRMSSPKMSVDTKRQRVCPHTPQECMLRGADVAGCHSQSGPEQRVHLGIGSSERHIEHDLGSPCAQVPGVSCMEPFSLHPDTPERPEPCSPSPASPRPGTSRAPDVAREKESSSEGSQRQRQQQSLQQREHKSQPQSQHQSPQQGGQRGPWGGGGRKEGDIFRAALDGDLEGLARCLQASPSSINAKKSATWQTPLHCAAAAGRAEALELLTHWTGQDSANLEARNTYGETPLHVAAKNCNPDAVRILLKAGACVAAQTNNGMTALHLAAWSTGSSEDTDVVRLLLSFGAPLEYKDKDGRTPMDLVPRGNSSVAVLLAHHLRLQQASKAQASLAKPQSGREVLEELEEELRRIVGVPELKAQLRRWAKGLLLDRRRRSLGLDIRPQQAPHMAFLGNPGTGKTSVARALSRLLQRVGVVAEDKLVEVQRTDLVGEFVGHTGPKTRAVIERAKGGVLFVDEAYRLVPAFKAGEKDYGLEALEEIMAAMDSGTLVVILAGYKEPMKRVFDANEGLRRRVARCFEFEDLSCSDIARVMMLKMERPKTEEGSRSGCDSDVKPRSVTGTVCGVPHAEDPLQGFRLHSECTEESLAGLVARATSQELRQKHNGALALTALVAARSHLDARLDVDCDDPEELISIRLSDIAAGLQQVSH